jgi:exopolysaccharide biosynthesis polyprenyl glycosylphosphotransferase
VSTRHSRARIVIYFSLSPLKSVTEILGRPQPPPNESVGHRLSPKGRSTPGGRAAAQGLVAAIIRDPGSGSLLQQPNRGPPFRSTEVSSYLRLSQISDISIALVTLLGLFILDNLGHIPQGWQEFLEVRLTVKNLGLLVAFTVLWQVAFRAMQLYHWNVVKFKMKEAVRIFAATGIGTLVAFVFPLTSDSGAFRFEIVLLFFAVSSWAILIARTVIRRTTTGRLNAVQNIVILGSGPRAAQMYRYLCEDGSRPRHLLGFFDSELAVSVDQEVALRLAGSLQDLESFLMNNPVDEVVIALPVKSQYSQVQEAIQICERVGVHITYPADVFTHARTSPRLEFKGLASMIAVPNIARGPWFGIKRALDLGGASVGLIVFLPLMLLTALIVKATSPGPIFFTQMRCGRNRRHFKMYKFRTMVENAEIQQLEMEAQNEVAGPLFKMRCDPRVTRVGAFLRRTSIDELPQLWNVLRGEMSLVGPRPLPLRDVQRFSHSWLMRRFSVLPGLTGLWQVSGRSSLSNKEDWIALDLAYVDHWSFWLDLEILVRTVPAVLSGKGAS